MKKGRHVPFFFLFTPTNHFTVCIHQNLFESTPLKVLARMMDQAFGLWYLPKVVNFVACIAPIQILGIRMAGATYPSTS
jgi:hypothetical protein